MPPKKKVEPEIKKSVSKKQDIILSLNKQELEHLRNLFSIIVPSESDSTVSSMLASITAKNNSKFEQTLWNKITTACVETGIDVGEAAPDFVVGTVTGIYQVEYEEDGED